MKTSPKIFLWAMLVFTTVPTNEAGFRPISNLLKYLIQPFLSSIHIVRNNEHTEYRSQTKEISIAQVIERTVKELEPFLSDKDAEITDKYNDNKEDTTIIEFSPQINRRNNEKISLQPKSLREKYNTTKEQIVKLMQEEKVSEEMQHLVATVIDELVQQIVQSPCSWQSNIETPDHVYRRYNIDTRRILQKMSYINDTEWMNLRKQYTDFLNFRHVRESKLIPQFHDFFQSVLLDATNRAEKYKVKCKLVKVQENKVPRTDNGKCNAVKICSKELTAFLDECNTAFNRTNLGVFDNYIESIQKNKHMRSKKKSKTITMIQEISKLSAKKGTKVVKHAIQNLTLDKNKDEKVNMKRLKKLVRSITPELKHSNLKVMNTVSEKIESLQNFRADLAVDLEKDLSITEQALLDRICPVFSTCNGIYTSRRSFSNQGKGIDVYVKLKRKNNHPNTSFRRTMKTEVNKTKSDFKTNFNHGMKVTRTTWPTLANFTQNVITNITNKLKL